MFKFPFLDIEAKHSNTSTLLSVSVAEPSDSLEMPWIEVWLGVLFGDFQLEQREEFYELPIWVKCSRRPDNGSEARWTARIADKSGKGILGSLETFTPAATEM